LNRSHELPAAAAFRSDINGLRALAVLPVLLFHSGFSAFRGGFLGVDVFFVISGFLITGKIQHELMDARFSFRGFYDNRARRILPALIAVALASTAAALLLMVPYSLKNFGQSLVASLLSANNLLLLATSGYWSSAAEFKPLYHTWSLGVEEQYYLLAPLLLFLCFKFGRRKPALVIGVCGALLGASLLATCLDGNRESAFLLLFTRAWELLCGCLLVLLPPPARRPPALAALGLALLLCSYVEPSLLGQQQALIVAMPVLGACCVIRYAAPDSILARALSINPLMVLGFISYSVYLWHQPILAFLRLASATPPSPWLRLAWASLSIPLGYLSWRYVENVFRDRRRVSVTAFYSLLGASFMVLGLVGVVLHLTYGLQNLYPQYSYGESPKTYVDQPFALRDVAFHDRRQEQVLVIGNSFARDYINMLRESGYLSLLDVVYLEGDCLHHDGIFPESLLSSASLVVFTENWAEGNYSYSKDVDDAYACYQELRSKAHGRVVVIGAKNFGWNNDFVRLDGSKFETIRVAPLQSVTEFNLALKVRLGDDFVDLMATLKDDEGRVPLFTPEGRFITFDTNHLTRSGAVFVGKKLFATYPFLRPGSALAKLARVSEPEQ
jgi:peptidoglycan/LPS O-acetylase OafA/YrhL